ncbi:MAG: alcohol dehydrogenase catalytic domain-containing protein [Candidatus Humimicrobiaceae bacterium]
MIAGVFLGNGKFEVQEVPKPKIDEKNNVLLKNKVASVCGTDLKILSVPQQHPARDGNILGHEYCGQVEEVGPNVSHVKVGDRVVLDVNFPCGYCYYCLHNLPEYCLNMNSIGIKQDGGFAQYSVVPEKSLIKMPDSLNYEQGAFIEVIATMINGFWKLNFSIGQSAVIFGAGPIGCLMIEMLRKSGASKIYSIELKEYRANFVKKIGADYAYNASVENIDDIVADILSKEPYGVDVTIDVGYGVSFPETIKLARKGGKVLLFGVNSQATQVVKQYEITTHGLQIFGNWIYNYVNPFSAAFKLLESGIVNVEDFITRRLDLKDMNEGIESLKKGEDIKVMVNCN